MIDLGGHGVLCACKVFGNDYLLLNVLCLIFIPVQSDLFMFAISARCLVVRFGWAWCLVCVQNAWERLLIPKRVVLFFVLVQSDLFTFAISARCLVVRFGGV
jgi:hypothetical protein